MDAWGWRVAFALYAGLHLFLCFPLHRLFVPRRLRALAEGMEEQPSAQSASAPRRLRWLVLAFGSAAFVSSVIAVHVIGLLTAAGLTQAQRGDAQGCPFPRARHRRARWCRRRRCAW